MTDDEMTLHVPTAWEQSEATDHQRGGMAQHDLNWKLRLAFLIHDVSRLRKSLIDRELKPLGVTRSQWWVLAFLSRHDGMSQVALADELDLGKVALGGLIDRLEAAGLVRREPDKTDRRVKRLFLTTAGRDLMDQIRANVRNAEDEILAGIPDNSLLEVGEALRAMKHNLLGALRTNGSVEPDADQDA